MNRNASQFVRTILNASIFLLSVTAMYVGQAEEPAEPRRPDQLIGLTAAGLASACIETTKNAARDVKGGADDKTFLTIASMLHIWEDVLKTESVSTGDMPQLLSIRRSPPNRETLAYCGQLALRKLRAIPREEAVALTKELKAEAVVLKSEVESKSQQEALTRSAPAAVQIKKPDAENGDIRKGLTDPQKRAQAELAAPSTQASRKVAEPSTDLTLPVLDSEQVVSLIERLCP